MNITLTEQIKEVKREIGQRKQVYKRLVQLNRMKQSVADHQVEIMQAVLITLQTVSVQRGDTLL